MIGSLGSIIFQVSDDYFLSFSDISFSRSATYAEHKIIDAAPLLEFTGLSSGTCSLKIIFDADQGLNPKKQIDELTDMLNNHEVLDFVIDGCLIGSGAWVIENLNYSIDRLDNFGGWHKVSANLSLKEYI